MCRRSQFATRIANCPLYYVTATLLRRDIHRGQPAPRWSGRDRLFSLPRQGDQVFPPPVHTTGRPRTRITSLLLLRVSYCSMIVDSCPRFYARCVQYAASSSFILFPFRFFSLCINVAVLLRLLLYLIFPPVSLFARFDRENELCSKLVAPDLPHPVFLISLRRDCMNARSQKTSRFSFFFLFFFFFFQSLVSFLFLQTFRFRTKHGRTHDFVDFSYELIAFRNADLFPGEGSSQFDDEKWEGGG